MHKDIPSQFSHIKALALDLDGTILLPDNSLSERTIRTLKQCLDRKIKIIICTGRSSSASEIYRAAIGTQGPMVYFNGAEITAMPDGKPFYPALLKAEVVDYCVDISRRIGAYFQVYVPETKEFPHKTLAAEKVTADTDMYFKHTGSRAVICDLKQMLAASGSMGCIKAMFLTDIETQETIRALLLERFGNSIYITRTLITFLEVMTSGISKGNGLKIAMERLGLKADEVMAFGDEENDIPLFDTAGLSAAPLNAKERVREAADIVVRPNTEDGVAAFLEENLLIP